MKIAILINLSANHNKATVKWEKIKDKLYFLEKGNTIIRIPYRVPFDINDCVSKLYSNEGVTYFISAGGDGSIHYLINAIKNIGKNSKLEEFTIGGIGLGSSNDFLKPFDHMIAGVPVKIDYAHSYMQDIGSVAYDTDTRGKQHKLFLINASIGLLAKANHIFNKGDRFINFFKRKKLEWAINYTAVKTLFTYTSSSVNIISPLEKKRVKLTSLSVLKNPNVSGSFRFNQNITPNEGSFGVNYAYNQNFISVIRTIVDLANGCFISKKPKKGRASYKCNQLEVSSGSSLYLETDGEVEIARNVSFSIYPHTIRIMK
ncbi:diacylglycerol kinase family protein [Aquimarina sp. RZ0]|uniref:diacylglycerol/lipid kinase family protein n=1 Tax=Aquimarina sp. RZ0 TaxID=2607730 RepID=UPI0011F1C4F7|nr:diacylglycerol kinase family protein [Aquimarina sp. RZ0]KAA1243611.1 hypothetical protein F0000_20225 [Aquimarina sp. RZ0]